MRAFQWNTQVDNCSFLIVHSHRDQTNHRNWIKWTKIQNLLRILLYCDGLKFIAVVHQNENPAATHLADIRISVCWTWKKKDQSVSNPCLIFHWFMHTTRYPGFAKRNSLLMWKNKIFRVTMMGFWIVWEDRICAKMIIM